MSRKNNHREKCPGKTNTKEKTTIWEQNITGEKQYVLLFSTGHAILYVDGFIDSIFFKKKKYNLK